MFNENSASIRDISNLPKAFNTSVPSLYGNCRRSCCFPSYSRRETANQTPPCCAVAVNVPAAAFLVTLLAFSPEEDKPYHVRHNNQLHVF